MFALWQILLTAGLTAAGGLALLRWRLSALSVWESVSLSLLAGVSVALSRLAGNVPLLNDDPIGGLSPNDFLAPVVTYVGLALYADLRGRSTETVMARARAWLVIVAFLVNVFTI